ncbi:cupin domain-containing protein [Bradyrhizobium sp. Tv2a-2]|uniref:cupin domain-containing protein n=1 Tax=Bradyrhizobium sp. Tv2a-2 TaxID=113395 RepID=UPI0003F5BFAA|nr:cupin domain-containing protein [Bradyrhizobium sp. Tv2a-2]
MYTKQIDRSLMRTEYGVLVSRLLEHLPNGLRTEFGISIVVVAPGGAVDLHAHHEHEIWVLISGHGEYEADGQKQSISEMTLCYMPPHQKHAIRNISQDIELKFLSIWWE